MNAPSASASASFSAAGAAFILTLFTPAAAEVNLLAGAAGTGSRHLTALLSRPWATAWRDIRMAARPRLVEPRRGLAFPSPPGSVWHVPLVFPDGRPAGYLMWDAAGTGALTDFSLEGPPASLTGTDGGLVKGVPALQQFPLPDGAGGSVASGCVPTAGASVIGFWAGRGHPAWSGTLSTADGSPLPGLASRLRSRLAMSTIPDRDGYTADGMSLAGAMPKDLATAIQKDAEEFQVPFKAEFHSFSFGRLRNEITAGRPVLLSCVVRLPYKPELSWGHEVAAVAWLKMDSGEFAGVTDNFYPSAHPETLRWIRADAFQTLITVRPEVR